MRWPLRPLVALGASSLTLVAAGCGSSSSAIQEPSASLANAGATGATGAQGPPQGCQTAPAPPPKSTQAAKPTLTLDPSKTETVQFQTNCGSFTITLDAKRAPKTAANFAALAKQGFYDNLTFHRVDTGLGIIQGGDPQGSGQGGPGYTIVEAPPAGIKYTPGVVAMAKTGSQAAGTSGSQFFIVTGPQATTQLTPVYAVVGTVSQGSDVVQRIATVGTDASTQKPVTPMVIQKATFSG